MPIPCKMNPFGKSNKPTAFELIVKPGILTTGMSYGFTPYWNEGGYCFVDWGDGSKEDATKSGTKLNHNYAEAGTYTIKIKSECYQVGFAGWDSYPIVDSCSGDWDKLGNLTSGYLMFYNCTNMQIDCTSLPDGLTNGQLMFCLCKTAKFSSVSLPESLTNGSSMFDSCSNAELPLISLPNALTNGNNMFSGCRNAQLPLASLPEGLTTARGMFYVCGKAEIKLTKLPSELTDCYRMFQYCNAEINLDTLVANAPEEGWTKLTNITNMFNGCSKVTGSRSAFLAKCPANVTGADTAFIGTNTTE